MKPAAAYNFVFKLTAAETDSRAKVALHLFLSLPHDCIFFFLFLYGIASRSPVRFVITCSQLQFSTTVGSVIVSWKYSLGDGGIVVSAPIERKVAAPC